jgi:hypothetical protein
MWLIYKNLEMWGFSYRGRRKFFATALPKEDSGCQLGFCIVGVSIQLEPIEKPPKTGPISVERLNSIPFNLSFAPPPHSAAERHNLPELWTFSDVVLPLLNKLKGCLTFALFAFACGC